MCPPRSSRSGPTAARTSFWEGQYAEKNVDEVSWWQPVPDLSVGLVEAAGLDRAQPVVDVGAGWSTLVDHLCERGYTDLTAIDLSASALQTVRDRLGAAAEHVVLEVADVLDLPDGPRYALWHDRAVFHFLTEPDERDDYRASLARRLAPGGFVVVATFGPDGPATCSGLPIVRYTHQDLAAQFPGYRLLRTAGEEHVTAWGSKQQFIALLLQQEPIGQTTP